MKTRRHHNNKGLRQVKGGKTEEQVRAMAKKLGIKYDDNRSNNPLKELGEKRHNVAGQREWLDAKNEYNSQEARVFLYENDPSGWKILSVLLPALAVYSGDWLQEDLLKWAKDWHIENPTIKTKRCNDDFGQYEGFQIKFRDVAMAIRCAICGSIESPPIFEAMEILGREESLKRLRQTVMLHG